MHKIKHHFRRFLKFVKGFTLIEILVAIGIIAVLSTIVIVAINPSRQFAKAKDAKRTNDTKTIYDAVVQYQVDNKGKLPATIPTGETEIWNGALPNSSGFVDLNDLTLNETYISSIPSDPDCPDNCGEPNGTGYFIKKNSNDRIVVNAPLLSEPTPTPPQVPIHGACTGPTIETATTCFDTIEEALVDASPNDYIVVTADLYTPSSTLVINKNGIKLRGAKADIDPRPSQGTTRIPGDVSTESVIDGGNTTNNIIKIAASNVTIEGFTVRNGQADMIRQDASYSNSIVQYNIVYDGNGDEGVQLANCTDCFIRYNYVYDIAVGGDGLNFANATRGTITQNEVTNVIGTAGAIYTYSGNNITISNNLVYNVDKYGGGGGYGIKMGDTNNTVTAGTISGNTVYDIESDGMKVMYCAGCVISGNTIYDSRSTSAALQLAVSVSNPSVTGNTIRNNTSNGILVTNLSQDASTFSITGNDIYGNSGNGIQNDNAALLPATGNWWGDNSGPADSNGADGSTPATNAGSGNAAYGKINYSSWTTH